MKIIICFLYVTLTLLISLGLTISACDDDDDEDDGDDDIGDDDSGDDDDDDDTADDDTGDDDTGGDDDDAIPPTAPITVHVYDFFTGLSLEAVACELIDNATGNPFNPPLTDSSDADGICKFNQSSAAGETFAIKFSVAGYVTTYALNNDSDIEWYFPMVEPAVRQTVALLLGVTIDPSKGVAAGIVQWIDGTDLDDIGCAAVVSSAGDAVYYFGAVGLPDASRKTTHPANGLFLSFNVDAAPVTYTATTDGNVEDTTFSTVFADSVTYSNIIYDSGAYPTNPTPSACTK